MYSANDLQLEAKEALDKVWFVQSLAEVERTDRTFSLRLYIRPALFASLYRRANGFSLFRAGRRQTTHVWH
jgi:hypothetical protein